MDIIKHRVNTIAGLAAVETGWGIELDLRSHLTPGKPQAQALHLAHDPWTPGDDFGAWLAAVKARGVQGPLILNTKEDGLEEVCLALMAQHGLANFFFLDTALPTLVRLTRGGESRFAVRYSTFEPRTLARRFAGKVQWLWVDCFGGEPPALVDVRTLKEDFKICLVSPELQIGLTDPDAVTRRLAAFSRVRELADAVCTKLPERWV